MSSSKPWDTSSVKPESERRAAAWIVALALCACGEASEGPAGEGGLLSAGGREGYASASHTCEVVEGVARCWGAAESGQTGAGRVARRDAEPVRLGGLPPVQAVAAGGRHTCVSTGDAVHCFGDNAHGQGGVSRPFLLLAPTAVPLLPRPVTALAAGRDHSCAVAGGAVWCWGRNEAGESGRPAPPRCREPFRVRRCSIDPTRVGGFAGGEALALGDRHSCALVGGGVYCWGANDAGQLGDGGFTSRARPRLVKGLPGPAAAIAAGAAHTCALSDARVFCWGAGTATPGPWPGALRGLHSLAAGGDRTCAATRDDVWCAGAGEAPTRVPDVGPGVRGLAVGLDHACARLAETTRCWGENDFAQLGSGPPPEPAAREPWQAGPLRDTSGDGRISVVCLGDSNTARMPGAAAPWCDRLAPLLPSGFRVLNRGQGGATARQGASLFGAEAPVDYVIENDAAEVAVLAYGTNDALARVPAAQIAEALVGLAERLRVAGVLPLVALSPPVRHDGNAVNQVLQELNEALRAAFPAEQVVDFASGFGDAELVDRVHLGDAGQARRAVLAAEAILRFARAEVPVGGGSVSEPAP